METIRSINFDGQYEGHKPVIDLVNEYASLRPAFSPTALIKDVLLEVLPQKIAELKDKVKQIPQITKEAANA